MKVEDPDTGDPVHSIKLFSESDVRYTGGINAAFQQVSRGKASVAINLQAPLGQEVVRRMTARSGVPVTNLILCGQECCGLRY